MKNNKWTLAQIQSWTQGQIISEKKNEFSELGTDTRQDLSGKVFVALKGDQYDAHDYLDKAVAAGAELLIIHTLKDQFKSLVDQVSILLVKDTLVSLQDWAQNYRDQLDTKIIAITGSNGKTTTKEFTAAILGSYKKTYFNHGSFNNHWGVPMTLLGIPTDSEFAVIEMGMNHAGEIEKLVYIADPDIVVCTMVGSAHIEFFGTLEKIAAAKNEIYIHSDETAIRIFNQDQDLTFDMMYPSAKKFPAGRMLTFSQKNKEADVYFKIEHSTSKGLSIYGSIAGVPGRADCPVFGSHNLTNLMAAATLAYAAGMKPEAIWHAMHLCQSTWGRNQFIQTAVGIDILFDGYNANLDSMKALIKNVSELPLKQRKIGIFGQMKELGALSSELHFQLGQLVAQEKFDGVFFVGENAADFEKGLLSADCKKYFVDTELSSKLKSQFLDFIKPQDFIFIKGSRGAKTERFVELCQPVNWSAKY
jgi:UDP-N-acetylmuramoyl-tripeptide--D-alanyl-D-alanine ligase